MILPNGVQLRLHESVGLFELAGHELVLAALLLEKVFLVCKHIDLLLPLAHQFVDSVQLFLKLLYDAFAALEDGGAELVRCKAPGGHIVCTANSNLN